MDKLISQIQQIPVFWHQIAFFSAAAFALFMALIPGQADPTAFINDKVKHILTFIVLCVLLDLAYPTADFTLWKPLAMLVFGIMIEVFQEMTGYRHFSVGDIIADIVGIAGYWLIRYFWVY